MKFASCEKNEVMKFKLNKSETHNSKPKICNSYPKTIR